jgi:hypothetical protein
MIRRLSKNKTIKFSLLFFYSRTLIKYFDGIFPRDTEENTEFAINFFTSIGLGGLT